ncbi:hypothetical protein [Mucilaginibacter sp. L196]|uniref:hypothetical protein n=1 Tax=Mucilaginibacter sp. L196 TaxID=1641870 RepID=UPI00131AB81C|nr:hypothetical protein [Mucilaginibacter sp. L196]
MPADASLLINLSAGDAAYGYLTVKALAEAHRQTVKDIVIVIDSIKAPYATFYDHAKRYAEPRYSENIRLITEAAYKLKDEGLADKIIELKTGDPSIKKLAAQFFKNRLKDTHDFRGAPITAYMVGLANCDTKYVVRYDGDIVLHQLPGTDWILEGIKNLETEKGIIAVSPCPSPQKSTDPAGEKFTDIHWFSTRCLLLNKELLMQQRPLIDIKYWPELTARRILKRTYPPAFESIITKSLKNKLFKTRYLVQEDAWFIHPEDKGKLFLELLPGIIKNVKAGKFPQIQAGNETVDLPAWKNFLQSTKD